MSKTPELYKSKWTSGGAYLERAGKARMKRTSESMEHTVVRMESQAMTRLVWSWMSFGGKALGTRAINECTL